MWINILRHGDVKLNFFTYIKDIFIVGLVMMIVSLGLLQLLV